MFYRITVWLKQHVAFITLLACMVVPAIGWMVNTIWPAQNYGYLNEQALLVVLALGVLVLYWTSPGAAVFLFFSGALLPVGSMLQYQQEHGGGWSVFVLAPLVGVLLVATLARCQRATIIYGFVALIANFVTGAIYNDVGQAVALCLLSTATTVAAARWVQETSAEGQLDDIQTALRIYNNAAQKRGP